MIGSFNLSNITLNSQDHWGPNPNFVFEQYKDLPFAPYNKFEKIGKFCDTTVAINRLVNAPAGGQPNKGPEDEEDFHVVESKIAGKKVGPPTRYRRNITANIVQPKQVPLSDPSHPQHRGKGTYAQKGNYRGGYGQRTMTTKTKFKDTSAVQGDWVFINEIQKSSFDKVKIYNEKVSDIAKIGSIKAYDRSLELRAVPRKELPIPLVTGTTITASTDTTEDRVILDEIEKDLSREGNDNLIIYTTDQILSAILTLKTSVFPWDVHATKIKNQIIFDLFEKDKVSYIDLLTVNENTSGNLPEEEKDMIKLCVEATNINKNFITFASSGPQRDYGKDHPLYKEGEKRVFRYRRWEVDRVEVVVRSEVDSYLPPKEDAEPKFVKLCALNESEISDWKTKLEGSRGALIGTELRNNACKVSKWICQAALAEIDEIKLAFITRQNQKDTSKHSLLSIESYSLASLGSSINYRLKDNWAILKSLAEVLSKQEDGEYALVKQAYKQSIKVYRMPKKEGEDL